MTHLALLFCLVSPQGDWLLERSPARARVEVSAEGDRLTLDNGLVRRTLALTPGVATTELYDQRNLASLVRAVEPEALLVLDGKELAIGGLVGQRNRAFLLPGELATLKAQQSPFRFAGHEAGTIAERLAWKRVRPSEGRAWPPPGVEVRLRFEREDGVRVTIHHELYDGLPVVGKWLTLENRSAREVRLDRCVTESLALVEGESSVEKSREWRNPPIQGFSDLSFCGIDKGRFPEVVRFLPDPAFATQVSYELKTLCLLRSEPPVGPAQVIAPGGTFTSHRTWLLVHDGDDRERRGLAVRRTYRTLAPWCTENPILMHVRSADPAAVRLAVDQCAEVGFEMVILTFGSGFDIESAAPAVLTRWKELADYSKSKGIELGGYGLLASRSVSAEHDVLDANGKRDTSVFGASPCLGSKWGEDYFKKLRAFFPATGMSVFEHDGSYPGDVCAATTHPGHRGLPDSQWNQWRTIADFYAWCRAEGIYLNVPDTYLLAGSSKLPMGYRETNWSLPRAEQVLHARQNIYDGTWEKTPSMGWMFVPLVEYHGGGAEATIEPLKDHLDVYAQHLQNCFGAGVQACWRGPRLYDGEATKALVAREVAFFKKHRAILESDVVHIRRADGRDFDGLVHVNPALPERALAVLYNPLSVAIRRTITIPLYYSGLHGACRMRVEDKEARSIELDSKCAARVELTVPAQGMTWATFEG